MENTYKIERYSGYEDIFEPLIRKITGAEQGRVYAGCEFENELFLIKPHYFGGCRCNHKKELESFNNDHKHSENCFQSYLKEVDEAFKKHPNYNNALILKTERINIIKSYCTKNNIKFKNSKDIENICTCDYKLELEKLNLEHSEECPIVSPNFWYKPEDIKIWWYKFFFRDSYANKEISIEKFKEIISNCLNNVSSIQQT